MHHAKVLYMWLLHGGARGLHNFGECQVLQKKNGGLIA